MASTNVHTIRTMSAPGPQTLTLSTTTPQTGTETTTEGQPILRLRGAPPPNRRSVSWAADVVDNEGLGRKKSKVCCIYRRPRGVDESSDESSSDSDSDTSDSDCDHAEANANKNKQPAKRPRTHNHAEGCRNHSAQRRPSPNAYERMPRNKPREEEQNRRG